MKKNMMIFLIVLGIQNTAFAGHDGASSGGGGTVCRVSDVNSGNPILFDLALSKTPISDPPIYSESLFATAMTRRLGMDDFPSALFSTVRAGIEERLNLWQDSSPRAVLFIRSALSTIQFKITPFQFARTYRAQISLGTSCQAPYLKGGVFYFDGQALVSIPTWNSIGQLSHRGLVLHESLRHIQLFNGYAGTDGELQSLTLKIMNTVPESRESLDDLPFFSDPNQIGKNKLRAHLQQVCLDLSSAGENLVPRSQEFKANLDVICSINAHDSYNARLLRPIQELYIADLEYELLALANAKTDQQVESVQKSLSDLRLLYYEVIADSLSEYSPLTDNAGKLASEFQSNMGFRLIRDYIAGNLNLTPAGNEEMNRAIQTTRNNLRQTIEIMPGQNANK
jgi:hypothetical protein